MALGKIDKCIYITGSAPHVNPDNAGGARVNELRYSHGINVMRSRIDITKHRSNSVPSQGMGRSNKSKRWKDHLPRKANGSRQNFKADRGITDAHAMLDTDQLANALLELL